MSTRNVGTADVIGEEYLTTPTWVVQYNPRSAQLLRRSWQGGEDFEYPNVDRHADEIHADDFILFWVSGPGAEAGVIGVGVASGVNEVRDHPKSYRDPEGPTVLRNSAEVALACVFIDPVVTRDELRRHPEFDEFDLFRMPNRPNAFPVTPEQWAIIFRRMEEVLGQ